MLMCRPPTMQRRGVWRILRLSHTDPYETLSQRKTAFELVMRAIGVLPAFCYCVWPHSLIYTRGSEVCVFNVITATCTTLMIDRVYESRLQYSDIPWREAMTMILRAQAERAPTHLTSNGGGGGGHGLVLLLSSNIE